MPEFDYIAGNLADVYRRIEAAKARAGRQGAVRLVAVTKSASDEELCALCALGVKDVGENRPQELVRRGKLLAEAGFSPRLHQIGNLQKNKVKKIAPVAALVHSVDSAPLADELEKAAASIGRKLPVLIEVNIADEPCKSGARPTEVETLCEHILTLPHLAPDGLMTMGPVLSDPEDYRPYFRALRKLRDDLTGRFGLPLPELSMGMSDSFEVAVEEGATIVRVGRRLFLHAPES